MSILHSASGCLSLRLLGGCVVALLALPSEARETVGSGFSEALKRSVDLSVSGGVRTEDNLIVEELDSIARESGVARVGAMARPSTRESAPPSLLDVRCPSVPLSPSRAPLQPPAQHL